MRQELIDAGSAPHVSLQTRLDDGDESGINIRQWRILDLVFNIGDGLQLHHAVLDVGEGKLAVGELIQNASQTPDISLVAYLDAWLLVTLSIKLWTIEILYRLWRHVVEGAHRVVDGDAGLV